LGVAGHPPSTTQKKATTKVPRDKWAEFLLNVDKGGLGAKDWENDVASRRSVAIHSG